MRGRIHQGGAVGIEFVLTFPLLFTLFYAIASYGLIFGASQIMRYAAEEGLRRSISFVDDSCFFSAGGCDVTAVRQEVESATRDVLREVARGATPDSLGSLFGQSLDSALQVSSETLTGGDCCKVSLSYDYDNFPFLPPLVLPVPAQLSAAASLKL